MIWPAAHARAPLLERESELSAVDSAVEDALDGRGRTLLIEGPPGIGKSTLLAATRERAGAAGFQVLHATCDELESAFPFGLAIHLLEPALGSDARGEVFEGPAGLAAELFESGPADDAAGAGDASFARIHGLTWLCANLSARGPLLLCADDAQWADGPSVAWLRYVARRLEGLSVLVAVVTRTGEPDSAEESVRELRAAPGAVVLRPAPLSEGAADELARLALGEDAAAEVARECHRASAGNPFFLGELLSELAARTPDDQAEYASELVPESVSAAVARRLARLPPSAATLAQALAILSDPAPLALAGALAGLDDRDAAAAVDGLAQAGLVSPGLPPRFAHPIVRGSVRAEIPAATCALLHRRAAEVLAQQRAKPELVAGHLLECEPEPCGWGSAALRESARRALGNGAPAAAARYLRRALGELPADAPRGPLLLELGRAQIDAGDPASIDVIEEALLADDSLDQVEALRELGRARAVFGRLGEAAEAFDRASAAAGEERPDLRLAVEAEFASIRLTLSRDSQVIERLGRHREGLTGRTGGERLLMAVAAFADAQANLPSGPSADLAERALAEWDEHSLQSASLCFYNGIFALLYADRYDAADRFLDEALRDARGRGSPTAVINASWLRAWIRLRRGLLAEAQAEATSVDDPHSESSGPSGPLMRAVLVETLVERGALDEAEAVLGDEAEGEVAGVFIFNPLLYSRGLLRLASGRIEEGVADVRTAGAPGGVVPAAFPWRSTAAVALLSLGAVEEARRLAREELELARAYGAPRALGIALRAMGLVEDDDRVDLLRQAVGVLEASPAQLEHARALCDLGAALRRTGTPAQAREPLRLAMDIAHRCGGRLVADRAHDELVATGARPRTKALSGRDALTPSELRVAQMAAEGRRNRDIAQDLFITVRTVEGHLSRAYTKLEITSRDALRAALET
jgi:DNA-binding CsgD family transcriptional regulator